MALQIKSTVNVAPDAKSLGYTYKPFQEEIITQKLQSNSRDIYNGCDMGLGKTIMTYGYAYNMGFKSILVICMASLRLNWLREAIWAGPNFVNRFAILAGSDLDALERKCLFKDGNFPSLMIVSYNMLLTNKRVRAYILQRQWDYVVCDEFHLCKNPFAGRSGVAVDILKRAPYSTILTGTPIVNSGADTFTAMSFIIPRIPNINPKLVKLCSDYDKYASTFAYKYVTESEILYKKVKNPEALKELFYSYGFFYRKMKRDVLPDLPDKTYMHVEIPIKAGRTPYDVDIKKLEKAMSSEGDSTRLKKEIPALATLMKEMGVVKANDGMFFEYVTNILDQNKPVVLGAYHKDVIAILREKYKKYNPVYIDGDVPPLKRQEAIDKFQNGKSQVFIGQIEAAGAGLTLHRASDVVFYEYMWSPSLILQFIDRVDRIGQKNAVTAHLLTSKNPLDSMIVKTFISKQKAIDKVF